MAKTVATVWYFTAIFSYPLLVCIVMFFIYKAESAMDWVPESETKKAVGQWSPWMALLLALTAATFRRIFHKSKDKKTMNLNGI